MTSEVVVRVMEPSEFASARALQVAAFGDDESIGVLLDALRDSWAWHEDLSFVAEVDGQIAGHVLYTSAILDAPKKLIDVLVLSPVGIRPDLHGQGLGTELVTRSLRALVGRPEPVVFLEGNPRYYERFGFVAGVDYGFVRPSVRTPQPAFQVRAIGDDPSPLDDPELSGQLVYCDAFWRTDSVGLR